MVYLITGGAGLSDLTSASVCWNGDQVLVMDNLSTGSMGAHPAPKAQDRMHYFLEPLKIASSSGTVDEADIIFIWLRW